MQPISFNLNIGVIKISLVQNTAAVNIGKNLLLDWDSHSKSNQGLGNITGDSNSLEQITNHLEDPDKIDLLCQDSKVTPVTDLQELVKIFFQEDKNEPAD